MEDEEYVQWEKIDEAIQDKIEEVRKQEQDIEDPITMSFLQVHEEILHDVRDNLEELKIEYPPEE